LINYNDYKLIYESITLKVALPLNHLSVQQVMIATYIWLRITLSYCVIGALITTLLSAYLQNVNLIAITLIMASFLCLGVYKAELTRRDTGLYNYFVKLSQQKHRDF